MCKKVLSHSPFRLIDFYSKVQGGNFAQSYIAPSWSSSSLSLSLTLPYPCHSSPTNDILIWMHIIWIEVWTSGTWMDTCINDLEMDVHGGDHHPGHWSVLLLHQNNLFSHQPPTCHISPLPLPTIRDALPFESTSLRWMKFRKLVIFSKFWEGLFNWSPNYKHGQM